VVPCHAAQGALNERWARKIVEKVIAVVQYDTE
jgi:hypothetical protein